MKKTALILAAGKGTRMKSKTPKVLHKVCGKPMLSHVMEAAAEAGIDESVVVLGHEIDKIIEYYPEINYVEQKEQKGTGHAVMCAEEKLPAEGMVVVICGDTPLITAETISRLMDFHAEENNTVTVLTAVIDNPKGYGRIVKDENGNITAIVEEKDASEEIRLIKEINSGIYCFEAGFLKESLSKLTDNTASKEYYLTQLIEIAVSEGRKTGALAADNPDETDGVNDRVQLAAAEKKMRAVINKAHMLNGVTIIDPETTYIDKNITIGRDTIIYPGAILSGKTVIGEDCIIGHNCRIVDSVVGDKTEIQSSTLTEAQVGSNTHVGPCAYLRPKAKVGNDCKIGDFVEVKNANIGDGSKASHLAYIGDADVGKDVNIGCGVVFVNYDGINKFRTTVDDEAFIGSNSNLVAPVHVQKHGYIAAGTTITKGVNEGALVVGRPKERVLEGWGERKMMQKKEKKNAK